MKRLLREIGYYKKEVVLAPLFKMTEALLDLLVPIIMKNIMDVGIVNGNKGYIVKMCLLLVGIAVLSLACAFVAQYFAAKASAGYAARIRRLLFKRIQSLSFSDLDSAGASTLITRMTDDVDLVQNGLNLTLRLFLRSPFIVFGAMIVAFTIDVKAALVFVVLIPVLMIIVFGIMLVTMPLYKKVQGALERVTKDTRENLRGVRMIRSFRLEKGEIRKFAEDTDNLKHFQEFAGFISAFLNPVTFILLHVAMVVLLYVGAIRVDTGLLTQGALVALINLMTQILAELIKFANLVIQMTRAGASLTRINEVLTRKRAARSDAEEETEEEYAPSASEIFMDRVSLNYNGSETAALSDVSLNIDKGRTVGIIGGTGSGKTSLLSLIAGYYEPTSGRVYLNGRDLRDVDRRELRRSVVTVMQKSVLFTGTVRDNLVFGLSEEEEAQVTDDVLEFVLKMADAYDFVMEKEGGLQASVDQEGRNFSGGQKQRLCIARALLMNPDILLLDDASSALDFATEAKIRENLKILRDGRTTVIVSERVRAVRDADRIYVLDKGRLVGGGTHGELMENCPIYRETVFLQKE